VIAEEDVVKERELHELGLAGVYDDDDEEDPAANSRERERKSSLKEKVRPTLEYTTDVLVAYDTKKDDKIQIERAYQLGLPPFALDRVQTLSTQKNTPLVTPSIHSPTNIMRRPFGRNNKFSAAK